MTWLPVTPAIPSACGQWMQALFSGCSRCGAQMRVIALIEDPAVIERILSWLGLWEPPQPGGPSPPTDPPSLPLSYHPVPDIA